MAASTMTVVADWVRFQSIEAADLAHLRREATLVIGGSNDFTGIGRRRFPGIEGCDEEDGTVEDRWP